MLNNTLFTWNPRGSYGEWRSQRRPDRFHWLRGCWTDSAHADTYTEDWFYFNNLVIVNHSLEEISQINRLWTFSLTQTFFDAQISTIVFPTSNLCKIVILPLQTNNFDIKSAPLTLYTFKQPCLLQIYMCDSKRRKTVLSESVDSLGHTWSWFFCDCAYLETWQLKSHQHLQFVSHLLLFQSAPLHSSSPLHLLQAAFSLLMVFLFTVAALKNTNPSSEDRKVFSLNKNQTRKWAMRKQSAKYSREQKTRRSNSKSGEWLTAAELKHSVQDWGQSKWS